MSCCSIETRRQLSTLLCGTVTLGALSVRYPLTDSPFVLKASHKALLAHTTAAHTKRCTVKLQMVNPFILSHTLSMYTSSISVQALSSDVYRAIRRRYECIVMAGVALEWKRVRADGCSGSVSLCSIKRLSMSARTSKGKRWIL